MGVAISEGEVRSFEGEDSVKEVCLSRGKSSVILLSTLFISFLVPLSKSYLL